LYQYSAQLSGTEDKPCCMMTWKKIHTYNVTALIVHGLKRGSSRQEVGWRKGMKFYKLTSEWKKHLVIHLLLWLWPRCWCQLCCITYPGRDDGRFCFSFIDLLCHLYSYVIWEYFFHL
jgi:hypothetical protein